MQQEKLVSIITPVYNAGKYLEETIKSVISQTYNNWELLLVNDCSTDNSKEIASKYLNEKIRWIDLETNQGAAIARNKGIEESKGRYICFLDADDLWENNKLEKQLQFINEKDAAFVFTSYAFADSNAIKNGKVAIVPNKIKYKEALKNTIIFTSTVMFDLNKLTKEDIYMPNVRRGQDSATWWKVLKKIDYAYGLNEVLSIYRRPENSLSSNKIKALKRTWYLYRHVENLSFIYSAYNFVIYCFNAVKRRV